jgi:hypothetical protein
MTTRIVTDANGRKHITTEPLLHPPQRPWVGLTKDEVELLSYIAEGNTWVAIERAEAKLKEKNT